VLAVTDGALTVRRGGRVRTGWLGLATRTLVAFAPAVVTVVLVRFWLDAAIADFVPSFWQDQVAYWHKIASFSEVRFATGYYGQDDVGVPWDPVRFSVNGPWLPAVYGSVGAVFGWGSSTSILVNMAVIGLGIAGFVALAQLDTTGSLVAGIAIVTTWPVLLYLPTASGESLNQALALVLAGVFVRAIRNGPGLSNVEQAMGIALLVVASVYRYSWAILVPVLILLCAPRVTPRRVVGAVLAGTVFMFALLTLTSVLQPAGNNRSIDALTSVRDDPSEIGPLARVTWENFEELLNPGIVDPTGPFPGPGPLEAAFVQGWAIVGLSVLAILALVAARWRVRVPERLRTLGSREAAFHVVNLGVTTVAALTLYLPYGYYRVLGAHLLMSLLVLVAFRRMAVVAVVAIANAIMVPSFLAAYERWEPNFSVDTAVVERERERFATLVRYEDAPRNAWCNTLVLPFEHFDWRVTVVPPGIGISYAITDSQPQPPRSRYVLLTDDPTVLGRMTDRSRLRRLGSGEAGTLYENPRSECFREARG
jgi:hypothetical protein